MTNKLLAIATQIMVIAIVVSVVLLFVGVGILVLIHACIVGRAFRGLSAAARPDRSDAAGNGLSADDLEKLPCYDFEPGEKGCSPIECAVCLESFKMGDRCRLLPVCKHSFHAQCVDSWLLRSPICPMCRTSADRRKGCVDTREGAVAMVGISFYGTLERW
ncbi:RING-H2 finger protein ATL74-like isoform X2 [Phoenix dactylifera]|uniref:RING-H2 finger protein ATL74-like isoform X2 n=1 Tax=Phoenix dactylifera TaxID=42345 RepID=A0A8B9AEI1_PHODC|nr:RING-H2 finger protein ATL74-like isoform X2 [Phoenix dactylifera]